MPLPSKEEQQLREVVESYLNPTKGKTADPAVGLGLSMELGLTYLESQRFKEADALFSRLETYNEPATRTSSWASWAAASCWH